MRRIIPLTVAGAASAVAWRTVVEPWWRTWGVDPDLSERPLPGDDLIAVPARSDTRSIEIGAPPSAVWPWLVQMGYGRGGWYSYDTVDMRGESADRIVPAWQSLAVGDILPTHPGGGFEVKGIDPGRALVVYADGELVRRQAKAAEGEAQAQAVVPANLRASGAFLGASQPADFAVSWAFVLEPVGDDRTRLIERLRLEERGGSSPLTQLLGPLLGFGVFLMVRRQLLGLRERAESGSTLSPEPSAGTTSEPQREAA
jgi:hypothetical protein